MSSEVLNATPTTEPTTSRIWANGIEHHVLRWQPTTVTQDVVVLCHGFLDVAWSYAWVAQRLVASGYHVIAFDWRGHGDSSWVGSGGYYHFPDYVLDLHRLLQKLVPAGARVHLVGHSMGGTACTLYCGTEAAAITTLTLIEGIGPIAHPVELAPARFEGFLRTTQPFIDVHPNDRRLGRTMEDLPAVLARLRIQNPALDEARGLWLAEKSARPTKDGWVWKFDPLHRTRSPFPFLAEMFAQFLGRLELPVLFISSDNGFHPPDEEARLSCVRNLRRLQFKGLGHNLHWFAPEEVGAAIAQHIGQASHTSQ